MIKHYDTQAPSGGGGGEDAIPMDFKRWYLAESRKGSLSEAYKEWRRRGQELCYDVAYSEGYENASEAAYRHLAQKKEPVLPWLDSINAHKRLIGELNEYIALISAELDDLVGMASVHGWRSTRFEAGKALRERISKCVEEVNSFLLESIPSSLPDGEVNDNNLK